MSWRACALHAAAAGIKQCSVALALISILFWHLQITPRQQISVLICFSLSWMIWTMARSAWLGWTRLSRLNKLMNEERDEINHNREQERQELTALYKARGFEGKLLNDVIDVLMADNDRLLQVMLEEEMNLQLGSQQHPLKQGLGALLGSLLASVFCITVLYFMDLSSLILASLFLQVLVGALSADWEERDIITAAVWSMGIAALPIGVAYFIGAYLI